MKATMDRIHVSPDGLLRLIVRSEGMDIVIGFEGYPWHTHADALASSYGLPEIEAVDRYVDAILGNRKRIAMSRNGNRTLDVWVTEDPETDLRYRATDETIEFRRWDKRT
jgi:hypothetical protein